MTIDASRLHRGMTVRDPNGHRLGRVVGVEGGYLHIKRGRILPDTMLASIADITDVSEDEIVLQMRGTIPGELNEGRNSGSRGVDVAERTHDERLR